jgi:hypothetical protein
MSFRYQASSVSGFATAANSSKAFRPSRWAISANIAFSPSGSSSRPTIRAPKHFGFPLDPHPSESEIVDAVFQPEKPIRGEPVESCNLRYFNSFEFFDHTP